MSTLSRQRPVAMNALADDGVVNAMGMMRFLILEWEPIDSSAAGSGSPSLRALAALVVQGIQLTT